MAISRFFPPRDENGKHVTMDRNRNGTFVLYADHLEKIKHLQEQIDYLTKAEIFGQTMTQKEFDDSVAKLFEKMTGDANGPTNGV